ncbi:hypothetical protein WN50_27350 [Limnoraphis robusta CS-951]|uniref:Uncharacterized protein n=1 Tax=Limnoraphis robusta CS-951 TaxID=1637645 RepID=A0A0F5Y826_9CYAN|nr:hypothetical protein WN50_27350 [Limnoraphis robusta CS-951]
MQTYKHSEPDVDEYKVEAVLNPTSDKHSTAIDEDQEVAVRQLKHWKQYFPNKKTVRPKNPKTGAPIHPDLEFA